MLASTDADRDDTRFPAFLNVGGILSTSAIENHGFQPTKWQEVQLWQAFVSNVEPLTKILHIPTVQPVVFEAINNPDGTCKNVKALLSAIYFAAATSLQPDDVNHLLGQEKRIAIKMLKQNFEQSLEQANILDSPTLTSLQALAIYLVSFLPRHVADDPAALTSRQLSVRAHNAGRSVWVLNGLAIRLAQSIGLHQDGKSFNLSPFDSEIRRRLWWHLWAKDARASEDHGITVASFDSPPYIHFPLNIDDSQISPSTDKPPTSKRGWSEMTFPLIIMRANDVLQRLYHTVKPPSDDPASEFNRKEALNQLIAQIEEYTQDCNLNIPIQRATQLFGQVLLRKLDFVSRQQLLNQSDSVRGNRESLAAGETLLSACEILELNRQIQTDDILRGFRWTFETYPQYHLLLYVLWYLCVHPTGPIVDRAWNVVEATFDHEIANQRDLIAGPGSKWAVLKLMREKAIHFRDVANNADPAGHTQADSGNLPMADFPAGALDQMETGMLADMVNLDQDAASFLDWGRLVDDFNTHSHTF